MLYVPKHGATGDAAGLPAAATRTQAQAAWVAERARALDVMHLHAHFATGATALACDVHARTGLPFSFTAHAKDIYHESVDFAFVRDAVLASAFTVTVSDHNVAHLVGACGVAVTPRLVRLYNGIDLRRFAFAGPSQRLKDHILAVGRFVEKKGFLDLIDAIAHVRDKGRVVRLTLVGTGEQEAQIHARITAHRLGALVTLTGALTQDQVIALMRTHTLMALPCVIGADGNRDGLPTVLLEAMASGLPVVSTDVTGIPEMIRDGATGRIVAQRSPRWLAGALDTLLASPQARASLAVAARADVERRFNLDTNVGILADYFRASRPTRRGGPCGRRRRRAATQNRGCDADCLRVRGPRHPGAGRQGGRRPRARTDRWLQQPRARRDRVRRAHRAGTT